jgi:glycosyltransferase involved in cell wall biosynthesis
MADLERQAQRLGLSEAVRFLGYLDRLRDLPDCYAAADVFVFASRTETQGLVLLEAMAAGLPVIALSAMGTADILADAGGALVPPDDPAAFGDALGTFLTRSDTWRDHAAQARQTALSWSDAAMATRLAQCYRESLDRRPGASARLPPKPTVA